MLVHLLEINFYHQLGCRFDILDSISLFFLFWHMQLYMSWYIIYFFVFIFTSSILFIFSSSLVLTSSIDVVFELSILKESFFISIWSCINIRRFYNCLISIKGHILTTGMMALMLTRSPDYVLPWVLQLSSCVIFGALDLTKNWSKCSPYIYNMKCWNEKNIRMSINSWQISQHICITTNVH